MTSSSLSRGQLVALAIIGILLFILGFLTGYFAIPNNEPSYFDTRRGKMDTGGKMQMKEEYFSTFYKSLSKREIVDNLQYVELILNLTSY